MAGLAASGLRFRFPCPQTVVSGSVPPWGRRGVGDKPRGERLRLALQEMGPIYVKFGQIISTRRDLVAPDIANELALLQDQVPPFPGAEAQAIVEGALKRPVGELFATQVLRAAMEGRIGFKEAYDLTGLRGGTFQEYARRLGADLP